MIQKTRESVREAIYGIVNRIKNDPRSQESVEFKQRVGESLLEIIKSEYQIKADGGTDSAGIKWDETQRSRRGEEIMIDTGDLLASLHVEETEDGFAIAFDMEYAIAALSKRPAWPSDGLPDEWTHEPIRVAKQVISEFILEQTAAMV